MKTVPTKCGKLDKGLNEMDVTLAELKGYEPGSMTPVAKREVNRISEYLKNAKYKLEEQESKTRASSRMRRFLQAKKGSETLDELITGLEKLEVKGLVIDSSAHQATLLQASPSSRKDVFTPQYNVPPTLDKLVLNLNDSGHTKGS